jgi:hypothetical protein
LSSGCSTSNAYSGSTYFEKKGEKVREGFGRCYIVRHGANPGTGDGWTFKISFLAQEGWQVDDFYFDRDWLHDWLIYGYDDETQTFSAAGHTIDTSCHAFQYTTIQIGYNELAKALAKKHEKVKHYGKFSPLNNRIYWLPENYTPENISGKKIKCRYFSTLTTFFRLFSTVVFMFGAACICRFFTEKLTSRLICACFACCWSTKNW